MFDISIGTMIPYDQAAKMIPQLNPFGFESYELDMNSSDPSKVDFEALAEALNLVLDGRKISAVGFYKNPILNETDRKNIGILIDNVQKLGCSVIGVFAGGNPEKTIPDTIPEYKNVWGPLAEKAGEKGVKIGFEGCGGGWYGGSHNIAFCEDAWNLMFDALPAASLGLEWEPAHACEQLCEPIQQLRRWAKRVVHLHGKDGTVAWDVIRQYGNATRQVTWDRTPSFGDTNWADIFTILIQAGFHGACDIEGYHDPVHYDDMEWTAQKTALDYLRRCRGGLEYIEGPNEYRGYQGTRIH